MIRDLCSDAVFCSSVGGAYLPVSTTISSFTVCGWTVPLPNLDTEVCDASGGFLLVVSDSATQLVFRQYGMIKSFHWDLWVGATVTPDGTAVDTGGQPLSYTNFADDYPSNPDMKTCVVLNKNWNYEWKNRQIFAGGAVYALCTDVEISPLLSPTSPVSTVGSNLSPESTVSDAGLTEHGTMEPGLDTTEPTGAGWRRLNITGADPDIRGPEGSSDIITTVANPETKAHVSEITDLPTSTSPSSVTFPEFVNSTPLLTNTKRATTVTGQPQWPSSLNTSITTPSLRLYFSTTIDSTYGPLPVATLSVLTCNNSTKNGTDYCCCVCAPHQKNITNLVDLLDKLRQTLTVDKASLSSTYRQKNSVEDNRITSVCMGCVAIVVLVVVIIIVIFLDVSHFLFRGYHVRVIQSD
ncbi:uncharacterized protein LOC110448937 [Mizuhopecten yessoensis]|uniref:uncharacterized protein LOC110448937 n=1 Tax=Mizuhopecten yessoensis TaxID=6573 RepID=UPI000B45904B|nr:uncharacterized protein LOC110448937 [Mizuhopecten yessoensis]